MTADRLIVNLSVLHDDALRAVLVALSVSYPALYISTGDIARVSSWMDHPTDADELPPGFRGRIGVVPVWEDPLLEPGRIGMDCNVQVGREVGYGSQGT